MIFKHRFLLLFVIFSAVFCGCQTKKQKIELAILVQLRQYPESRLQDIYKNFYQDRFGPGHAINSPESARQYLEKELQTMEESLCPMVEVLGWEHRFVRVNLEMVKNGKIGEEELLSAFIESAEAIDQDASGKWEKEWGMVTSVIQKRKLPVKDFEKDLQMIDSLLNINPIVALHHSQPFREHYHPHYRIVRKELYQSNLKE